MTLLALSPDASRLVVLHEPEDRVRIWDIPARKRFLDLPMDPKREYARYKYRLSRDGYLFVTATDGSLMVKGRSSGEIHILDMDTRNSQAHYRS